MKYKHYISDKFSFITFENIFNEKELDDIWKESLFLCHSKKLEYNDNYIKKSGAARREDGSVKKTNADIFLDNLYAYPSISNYLRYVKKPFELLDIEKIKKEDTNLNYFDSSKNGNTLFSYAQEGDYYESHNDKCDFTYIFWLFKEPKCFTGGDLYLHDINFRVEIKNNMGILFPGWPLHSVEKVHMIDNSEPFSGTGRFSFSTFFT